MSRENLPGADSSLFYANAAAWLVAAGLIVPTAIFGAKTIHDYTSSNPPHETVSASGVVSGQKEDDRSLLLVFVAGEGLALSAAIRWTRQLRGTSGNAPQVK